MMMTYPVMHLYKPVSIPAGDPSYLVDVEEQCVSEVQLMALEPQLRKHVMQTSTRSVVVRGKVFHAHTAWHMRPLVIEVLQIRNAS